MKRSAWHAWGYFRVEWSGSGYLDGDLPNIRSRLTLPTAPLQISTTESLTDPQPVILSHLSMDDGLLPYWLTFVRSGSNKCVSSIEVRHI